MSRAFPRARQGLLTADHSRRGRRCVTVLDPETMVVTVLEPWEHAVLVLCDGHRGTFAISRLVGDVDGFTPDEGLVKEAVEFFAREGLIEYTQSQALVPRFASARPQSIAALQAAYSEWHKDPERSSQILSARAASPFEVDPLLTKPEPAVEPSAMDAMDDAPTRLAPVVRDVKGKSLLRGATEPSGPPPQVEAPAPPFGDEPTLGVEPRSRAQTEIVPAAPPRAERKRPTRRRTPRARDKTQRIDSAAKEREMQEVLHMGEGLPRGRCPVCMAEVPAEARICPACGHRF